MTAAREGTEHHGQRGDLADPEERLAAFQREYGELVGGWRRAGWWVVGWREAAGPPLDQLARSPTPQLPCTACCECR